MDVAKDRLGTLGTATLRIRRGVMTKSMTTSALYKKQCCTQQSMIFNFLATEALLRLIYIE
ncbi:hypothetical protein C3F00_010715 [Pseudomonas sp. MWU13-2860]|nr:hypothetical protein C3F00_010715 [Pseudomonas sp. MWU13-2860]